MYTTKNGVVIIRPDPLPWVYDDGGRATAGYKGKTGDCVTRAIAIASQRPYQEIYDLVNQTGQAEHITKTKRHKSNARTGAYGYTEHRILAQLGFNWTPTMTIGSGCQVHLATGELPTGRLVVRLSGHLMAVIDGIMHDTYNDSRDGTRCVYGYWQK